MIAMVGTRLVIERGEVHDDDVGVQSQYLPEAVGRPFVLALFPIHLSETEVEDDAMRQRIIEIVRKLVQ